MADSLDPKSSSLPVHRGDVALQDYGHARTHRDDVALQDYVQERTHHGGSSRALHDDDFVDASASINPLGPPDWLRQELERSITALQHYPDPNCPELRSAIGRRHDCEPPQVVVGNGSSELLAWLPLVTESLPWLLFEPSFGEYRHRAVLAGRTVHTLELGPAPHFALDWKALETQLSTPHVVVLGHPNNPTGKLLDLERFARMRSRFPDSLFVVDEAFLDFCDAGKSTWAPASTNLLVLRSLTKTLAVPGLRLGYALGHASLVKRLAALLPPWSVNWLAQRVGVRAMSDSGSGAHLRAGLAPLKRELHKGLSALPNCTVIESAANWFLLSLPESGPRGSAVAVACAEGQVALRTCLDFAGLGDRYLRIAVRTRSQNSRVLGALEAALDVARKAPDDERLGGSPSIRPSRARKPAPHRIMLQGTSSDAGKSLLVTALCRCLSQDGYRVAPFKAQNMSNNSGVARDGGEIGRAQVVQAHACGLLADTRMNPVLLKPTSDRGSQVILRGEVLGHRDVLGYLATRELCLKTALKAFDELSESFDVLVCEGAGSSGEMNLRRADIVNMGFVEHREMPVLLVGDIDRGGVYASLVGHLEVMSESDRARVKGYLINRFRGDASLLADAHRWVAVHTGRPVLGVMPYLEDLKIPDEDRLSLQSGPKTFGPVDAPLRIAVVVPPHVSNADDIDPLTVESDVRLNLCERPDELGNPDVVILLGTKNTIGDLLHFRRIGLDQAILGAHAKGATVIGICGGLQMLGDRIEDESSVEALDCGVAALGLLPLVTRFYPDKRVRSCQATYLPTGAPLSGYEIHHGVTDFGRVTPLIVDASGQVLGGGLESLHVWGTYLHGLFESYAFRCSFLDRIRERKGLSPLGQARKPYGLEMAFDTLSDCFRRHVDYPEILRLMGLS